MTLRLLPLIAAIIPSAIGASTFDDALQEVMSNNLTARIESAREQAQVESIRGENTLESPEIEFTHLFGTTPRTDNKWNLSVSQSFDWPGVYAARREAARTAQTASHYLMESTLLDLRQEIKSLLIDIIYNTQLVEMQSELVERMDRMEEYYRKAADAGAETRLDYNKTVIERIAVHRELHSLEAQRESLVASLQALNGGKDVSAIIKNLGSAYPIVASVEGTVSAELIKERDPQYAAAKAAVEAARSMVKVEKRSAMPGFSIGYEHETEGDERFDGFSFGLSLPVWGRKHRIKASTLEAEASLMDAEMALARRVAEMNGDLRLLKSLRCIIDEYEPVINDKANLALLRKALEGGQINFLTYIQETNYFIAAKREYLDTLYQYNLTLARLSRYQ